MRPCCLCIDPVCWAASWPAMGYPSQSCGGGVEEDRGQAEVQRRVSGSLRTPDRPVVWARPGSGGGPHPKPVLVGLQAHHVVQDLGHGAGLARSWLWTQRAQLRAQRSRPSRELLRAVSRPEGLDLTAEYKYASGTKNPQDTSRVSTFDQLFPANHDKFGHMDLFGWRNIHAVRSQATLGVTRSFAVNFMYNSWWLASGPPVLDFPSSQPVFS